MKNIFIMAVCFFAMLHKSQAQINITIESSNPIVNVNDTFEVSFKTSPTVGSENMLVDGYQLVVNFDPNVFEAVSVNSNDTIFDFTPPSNVIDNDLGIIEQAGQALSNNGMSGVFELAKVVFRAKKGNLNSTITLTDGVVAETELVFEGTPLYDVSTPLTISTNGAPSIAITSPSTNSNLERATDITFTATATDLEDENSTLTVTWSPEAIFDTNNTGNAVTIKFLQPGTHIITATVTDSNNATNSTSIIVNIENPELTIIAPLQNSVLNSKDVTFELQPVGMDISDHFHFAINPADPNNVSPEERFNTSGTPGQTTFTYGEAENIKEGTNTVVVTIAAQFHNEFQNTKTILTFIVDSTQPEITLNGANPLRVLVNNPYVELGATATDSRDGVINDITIDASQVDTSQEGTYSVFYSATDIAGNTKMITRTVEVFAPTLSINAHDISAAEVALYPNPSSSQVFVKFPKNSRVSRTGIYTIDGRYIQIFEKPSTQDQLLQMNVSSYAKGMYLFVAEINGQTVFKRFTVK